MAGKKGEEVASLEGDGSEGELKVVGFDWMVVVVWRKLKEYNGVRERRELMILVRV